jgi:WD40 repeat protein
MDSRRIFLGALLLVLSVAPAPAWQDKPPPPQIQYLEGLPERPYSVAISPDGRTVMAGGVDGTIGIWDRQTGEPVRVFRAATGPLLGLSVSRSGNFYAASGTRGPVRIFELPRRNPLATLTGLTGDPTCVAISPDGRVAVSGDSAKIVRVFSLVNKAPLHDLPGHASPISGVAFIPAARTVLAAAVDGSLRGWLYTNRESRGVIQTAPSNAVVVNPEGKLVALAGNDGVVRTLAWPPAPRKQLVQHGANVPAVAITPDGKTIVSASENQQLQVFEGTTGKALKTLAGQQGTTTSLDLHPRETLVVTGNSTGAWQAWETAEGRPLPGRGGHQQSILAIAVSPAAGSRLATSGADGTVRTWTLATPPEPLAGHAMSLTSIVLAADGKTLVTGSADKTLRTWNTADRKPGPALPAAAAAVRVVASGPDARLLVRGDTAGHLELIARNAKPRTLGAHIGAVNAAAVFPDGKTIITAGADGKVRTWTLKPEPTATFPAHPGPLTVIARTIDGKRLATGSNDGRVRLLASGGGKVLRTLVGLPGTITSAAFSRNAALVVAGNNQGKVRIWNTADGTVVGELAVHTGAVSGVTLHPDGKRLVTAGADGNCKVWALPLPKPGAANKANKKKKDEPIKPLVMVAAHPGGVTSLVLSTDGNQILTGGADKQVKLLAITGQAVRTYSGHANPVRAVALTKDRVIAGGDDKTVRHWTRSNGAAGPVVTLPAAVLGLAVDTSGRRAAVTLADGSVRAIDLVAGAELEWFVGHKGPARQVTWTSADTVVTGGDDKSLRTVVVSAGSVHIADVTAVGDLALLPDGSGYFTGGADRTLKQWSSDGTPIKTLSTLAAPIRHVSVSPDGKRVAAGGDPLSSSKEVRGFQVADSKQLFSVQMPAGVTAMGMSGNNRLAVTDSGKALHWFDSATGKLLETSRTTAVATDLVATSKGRTVYLAGADNKAWVVRSSLDHLLAGHKGAVSGVAWSAEGRWLVSSGADNSLRQWDTTTGTATRTYTGSNKPLVALAVSADGKRMVAATNDNRILGWGVSADGGKAAVASDLAITTPAAISDLAINGNGSVVATAGADNVVSLWHTPTGKLLERLPGHTSTLRTVALAGDARRVVSGANDRFVFRWTPSVLAAFEAHKGPVRAAVFTPDGRHLITSGDDRRVARWMMPAGQPINEFAGSNGPVRAVAVSGNGRVLAAGGDDKILRTWALPEGQALAQSTLPAAITGVALDAAGTTVAASSDLVVRQFDLANVAGKPALVAQQNGHGHTKNATAIAIASNGRDVVTVGMDRTLQHWFSARGPAKTELAGHTGAVYASAFSPDDKLLATAGGDRTVRLWNLETGESAGTLEGHTHQVTGVSFNPQVKQLASTSLDGTLRVWPLEGDAEVRVFRDGVQGGLLAVDITPNGNVISVVGRDRRWRLLARDTLKPVRDLLGHANPIYAVTFNGSGNRAVTLDRSGKIFLWDSTNGNVRFHQQLPVKRATSLAFARDGSEVFVAGSDKRVLKVVIPTAAR